VAGHSRENEVLEVTEKGREKAQALTCFPTWPEMYYRRVNWSSATTVTAATDLGKIRTELERGGEEGRRGRGACTNSVRSSERWRSWRRLAGRPFYSPAKSVRGGEIFSAGRIFPIFAYKPELGDSPDAALAASASSRCAGEVGAL
jgi:hypothetical protein